VENLPSSALFSGCHDDRVITAADRRRDAIWLCLYTAGKLARCCSISGATMTYTLRLWLAAFLLAASSAQGAETVRFAVQKTGTAAWELGVIRAHKLDLQADLTIDTIDLASPEAGKIALIGGAADIIVSDWLWVSRERSSGARLVFYPYSTALGAVMVPKESPIQTPADLRGHRLGVAGGPIDKSWLLLQGALKQDGIDLKSQATIVYGTPPLLAEKALMGEMDATLNFWNFCAALEAKGMRRLIDIEDLLPQLGAKGPVAMVGYVFDETWAARHPAALARFIEVTRQAKNLLATSDGEWERISAFLDDKDPVTRNFYRDRYRQGIPRRSIDDEERDAQILLGVLAQQGGPELVGPASALAPGTFFRAVAGR
jgi:NitT/TauT family transport system substrate-binding protein